MWIIRTLIITSVLCSTASAQDSIVALDSGEPAPFQGQLFPADKALNWAKEIELCDVRLSLHKEQVADIKAAYTESYESRLETMRDSYELRIDALRQDSRERTRTDAEIIRDLQDTAFYEDPVFTLTLGIVVGFFSAVGAGAAL